MLVTQSGDYAIVVSNRCGSQQNNITVYETPLPILSLGEDTLLCPDSLLLLEANCQFCDSLKWNTGDYSSTILAPTGVYSIQAFNKCGIYSDIIKVGEAPLVHFELNKDTIGCPRIPLNIILDRENYKWPDGTIGNMGQLKASGIYNITLTDQYGCNHVDDIEVVEDYP